MDFSSKYLTQKLITYIGNKRKLLKFIDSTISEIKSDIGTPNPSMFDGFSGSGSVSRLFKTYSGYLVVNDLESYSETINLCYLANKSEIPPGTIEALHFLNSHKLDQMKAGFIEKHYAPKDDNSITEGERVFYTNRNAKIIDNVRRMIENYPHEIHPFLKAPLLVKASIHNNTSGVFKGFHKKDNIGHFGGAGENALVRIKGEIELEIPIWSDHECITDVLKGDTNQVVENIPSVDIAYYDPPYNQHPYGSNYFMLNVINDYNDPAIQDGVSGITTEWNKSNYNKRREAEGAMEDLLSKTSKKAKYILISYNDEGIIPTERFVSITEKFGDVSHRFETYQTYRGSKNLGKNKTLKDGTTRSLKVKEMLWVIKVK